MRGEGEEGKRLMILNSAEASEADVAADTVVVRDGFTCKWNSLAVDKLEWRSC